MPGVRFERWSGICSGRGGIGVCIVGRQLQDRVTAGDDVYGLCPLVGLAVKDDRPVRFHRVVSGA